MRKQLLMVPINDSSFYQENHLIPSVLWLACPEDQLPLLEEADFQLNDTEPVELTALYNDAKDLCRLLHNGVLVQVDTGALRSAGIALEQVRPDVWSVDSLPFSCCTLVDPAQKREQLWSLSHVMFMTTPTHFMYLLREMASSQEYEQIQEGFRTILNISPLSRQQTPPDLPESDVILYSDEDVSLSRAFYLDDRAGVFYIIPELMLETLDFGLDDDLVLVMYGNGLRAICTRDNIPYVSKNFFLGDTVVSKLAARLMEGRSF